MPGAVHPTFVRIRVASRPVSISRSLVLTVLAALVTGGSAHATPNSPDNQQTGSISARANLVLPHADATRLTPVPVLQRSLWEGLPGITVLDGAIALRSADTALAQSARFGPHLHLEGDYAVTALLENSSTDGRGALSLRTSTDKQPDWWQRTKRLDVGINAGRVYVAYWNQTGPEQTFWRGLDATGLTGPVPIALRRERGGFIVTVNGQEAGRVQDPGVFDGSPDVHVGLVAAPGNTVIVHSVSLESSGNAYVLPISVPASQPSAPTPRTLTRPDLSPKEAVLDGSGTTDVLSWDSWKSYQASRSGVRREDGTAVFSTDAPGSEIQVMNTMTFVNVGAGGFEASIKMDAYRPDDPTQRKSASILLGNVEREKFDGAHSFHVQVGIDAEGSLFVAVIDLNKEDPYQRYTYAVSAGDKIQPSSDELTVQITGRGETEQWSVIDPANGQVLVQGLSLPDPFIQDNGHVYIGVYPQAFEKIGIVQEVGYLTARALDPQ